MLDKAEHNWSLEGYTRTVIRTTTMSSHPASRPTCAPIQGKIVNIVPRESPDAILNIPAFMVMVNQVDDLE